VVYDGPALAEHAMDVRDLAPALLAIAETLEEANTVLNGNRAQVRVQVHASFKTRAAGDSDSASPFLRLLISRQQRDPGSVSAIYPHLASTVEDVPSRQGQYDADPNIYGSFQELATQLKALCGPGDAQTG
jgi:hypothetical protein